MAMIHRPWLLSLFVVTSAVQTLQAQPAGKILSHPPLRPLPDIAARPMGDGPAFFVDPSRGQDSAAGSENAPWRTVNRALRQLSGGDTLYLRGGVYREQVYCGVWGKPEAQITIRSYPGERAILDGGLAEFFDEPATAWAPFPGGAPDEYRSIKAYKNIRDVVGLFGDSHIALQTYWHAIDLRSNNELWTEDPRRS